MSDAVSEAVESLTNGGQQPLAHRLEDHVDQFNDTIANLTAENEQVVGLLLAMWSHIKYTSGDPMELLAGIAEKNTQIELQMLAVGLLKKDENGRLIPSERLPAQEEE